MSLNAAASLCPQRSIDCGRLHQATVPPDSPPRDASHTVCCSCGNLPWRDRRSVGHLAGAKRELKVEDSVEPRVPSGALRRYLRGLAMVRSASGSVGRSAAQVPSRRCGGSCLFPEQHGRGSRCPRVLICRPGRGRSGLLGGSGHFVTYRCAVTCRRPSVRRGATPGGEQGVNHGANGSLPIGCVGGLSKEGAQCGHALSEVALSHPSVEQPLPYCCFGELICARHSIGPGGISRSCRSRHCIDWRGCGALPCTGTSLTTKPRSRSMAWEGCLAGGLGWRAHGAPMHRGTSPCSALTGASGAGRPSRASEELRWWRLGWHGLGSASARWSVSSRTWSRSGVVGAPEVCRQWWRW